MGSALVATRGEGSSLLPPNTHLSLTGEYTFVPWALSFKRGQALEERENKIVVKEAGYFFIYSQVREMDPGRLAVPPFPADGLACPPGLVYRQHLRHGPPDSEEESPRVRERAEPGDSVPVHPEHARHVAQQLLLLGW